MTAALRVISPGLMTTLQDLGRPGFQRLGIPVSGALDTISLRAANLIVGNPSAMAALEIAYQGPMLAVEADNVRVALAVAAPTSRTFSTRSLEGRLILAISMSQPLPRPYAPR